MARKDRTVEADQRTRDEEAIASLKAMEDRERLANEWKARERRGWRSPGQRRVESKLTAWPGEATDLKAQKKRERNQEAARKQQEDEAAAAGLNARQQRDEQCSAIERRERRRGCKDENEQLFGNGNRGTQQSTSIVQVG